MLKHLLFPPPAKTTFYISNSLKNCHTLEIYGHTIDENYSKLLIERKDDIDLTDAVFLDKVQKSLSINDEAA